MTVATMTSKGQLTVPKAVRDRLGLRAGDRVRIEVDREGHATVRKLLRIEDLFGRFPGNGQGATLEQLREAGAEAVAEHVAGGFGR